MAPRSNEKKKEKRQPKIFITYVYTNTDILKSIHLWDLTQSIFFCQNITLGPGVCVCVCCVQMEYMDRSRTGSVYILGHILVFMRAAHLSFGTFCVRLDFVRTDGCDLVCMRPSDRGDIDDGGFVSRFPNFYNSFRCYEFKATALSKTNRQDCTSTQRLKQGAVHLAFLTRSSRHSISLICVVPNVSVRCLLLSMALFIACECDRQKKIYLNLYKFRYIFVCV